LSNYTNKSTYIYLHYSSTYKRVIYIFLIHASINTWQIKQNSELKKLFLEIFIVILIIKQNKCIIYLYATTLIGKHDYYVKYSIA